MNRPNGPNVAAGVGRRSPFGGVDGQWDLPGAVTWKLQTVADVPIPMLAQASPGDHDHVTTT